MRPRSLREFKELVGNDYQLRQGTDSPVTRALRAPPTAERPATERPSCAMVRSTNANRDVEMLTKALVFRSSRSIDISLYDQCEVSFLSGCGAPSATCTPYPWGFAE